MQSNRLLRALSRAQIRRLGPMEHVTFRRGDYVHRAEQPLTHYVFLAGGFVSLVSPLPDGENVTVWSFDGTLVGGQTVFQIHRPTYNAVMRTEAEGWRIAREAMNRAIEADPGLREIMLNWVHYMDSAITISAGCQIAHSMEKRICRLLLAAAFSTRTNRVPLSLNEIAGMLPGARTHVYRTAGVLRAAGGIHMARGVTEIVNSAVLEARACGCYAAITRGYHAAIRNP